MYRTIFVTFLKIRLVSRPKEGGASSEDSTHIRFFSFSLIEGYISLVMDEQTAGRLAWAATTCCVDSEWGRRPQELFKADQRHQFTAQLNRKFILGQ